MSEYTSDTVIVDATLQQRVAVLCPNSGDTYALDARVIGKLDKDQLKLYGKDWLDVTAADVPNGWMVQVEQICKFTSEQAPRIDEELGFYNEAWLPLRVAMQRAKAQLDRWAGLKRWGAGGP